MPDNIAVANGLEMMAYQGEMPWHRLGVTLDGEESVEDVLNKANLNWEIGLWDMFVRAKAEGDDLPLEASFKVPNRRAVVRLTGEPEPVILGTVGDAYQPLQNAVAFAPMQLAVSEFGATIETAGGLDLGRRVWMLMKLPKTIEVVDGDQLECYFLIVTGHDGATNYTARPTPVRVVCQNTLEIALQSSKAVVRLSHNKNRDEELAMLSVMIRDLVKTMSLKAETFRKMARFPMNALEVGRYVNHVLGIADLTKISPIVERRRQSILGLFKAGKGADLAPESLWAAYNAVTEYIDHVRPAEAKTLARKRTANISAVFGANTALKARALSLAEQILDE